MTHAHRTAARLSIVVAIFQLAACSPEKDRPEAGWTPPPPGDPTTGTISGQVCAAGGTLSVAGVTLEIPPAAFTACKSITLTVGGALPAGYDTYSQLVTIAPALTLAAPATLTVPFTGTNTAAARLFWSYSGSQGWERRSDAATGNRLSAQLTRLGNGFVADGVDYVDTPDRSCVKTRLIEGRTTTPASPSPATVAVFFTVDDCQGRPVTGLTCSSYPSLCDFVLKENGTSLTSEASAVILPRTGVAEVFMTLLIDMSSSTSANLSDVVAGAKAFVHKLQVDLGLRVQIALKLFDGGATLTTWQPHTLDTARLEARLDLLGTYVAADPSSTNLYGALILALDEQTVAENAFKARNYGGAFTPGYVVVFTDGNDTANRKTKAAVQTAETTTGDDVVGVALKSVDLDLAALQAVAPNGVLMATTPAGLLQEFEALATSRIKGQIERTYLLGYCSPLRALNNNTVAVEVSGATNSAVASYKFDATSFGPGCSITTIQNQCAGLTCGGLGCGACDDRIEGCDSTTSQCVSPCQLAGACGGAVITPYGYSHTCADAPPTRVDCGELACTDLTSDAFHCGDCATACVSGVCAAGICAP
jgi:hypothetical protein